MKSRSQIPSRTLDILTKVYLDFPQFLQRMSDSYLKQATSTCSIDLFFSLTLITVLYGNGNRLEMKQNNVPANHICTTHSLLYRSVTKSRMIISLNRVARMGVMRN